MYKKISKNTKYELTEKKSKFIANLIYVENKDDAENKIKEFKKKFHDARHNCFAYRVLLENQIYEKSSDDGEPSGTAGSPMLNILQKNNLCNILVIVTRYFGGILLGTGGLVRAYSESLNQALNNTELFDINVGYVVEVKVKYTDIKQLKYYCEKNNINISKFEYGESVFCFLEIKEEFWNAFQADVAEERLIVEGVKKRRKNDFLMFENRLNNFFLFLKPKYIIFQSLGVEILMYLQFFLQKFSYNVDFSNRPRLSLRLLNLRVISKQYI